VAPGPGGDEVTTPVGGGPAGPNGAGDGGGPRAPVPGGDGHPPGGWRQPGPGGTTGGGAGGGGASAR